VLGAAFKIIWGGSMSSLGVGVESNFKDNFKNHLDENEIKLVKKASRAFAVSYVNEIYKTVKTLDPDLFKKLKNSNEFPYYLHLFIHQEESGKIDRLDIYTEYKPEADGLCEVREIYHCSECEGSFIEERERCLSLRCMKWHLSQLDISNMYTTALFAGKKVGKSLHNLSNLTSRLSS
jgi:hypothetical protein